MPTQSERGVSAEGKGSDLCSRVVWLRARAAVAARLAPGRLGIICTTVLLDLVCTGEMS